MIIEGVGLPGLKMQDVVLNHPLRVTLLLRRVLLCFVCLGDLEGSGYQREMVQPVVFG